MMLDVLHGIVWMERLRQRTVSQFYDQPVAFIHLVGAPSQLLITYSIPLAVKEVEEGGCLKRLYGGGIYCPGAPPLHLRCRRGLRQKKRVTVRWRNPICLLISLLFS